jgi:nucleobase:cation symporter-1, NCS1 family
MNAYGGMLTVLTGIDSFKKLKPRRIHRVVTIVVLTVIWFVISQVITGGAVSTVATSLTLMLYLLVPWTAANLVDFFFVRRGHYAITDLFRLDGIYGVWGWRGLTAYAVGLLAEVPFMVLPQLGSWSYIGPIANAMDGVDIAWLVGLIVSAVVYLVLSRSLDLTAERTAEQSSNAALGHGAHA